MRSGEEAEDPEICCIWDVGDLEHNMECRGGAETGSNEGAWKAGDKPVLAKKGVSNIAT